MVDLLVCFDWCVCRLIAWSIYRCVCLLIGRFPGIRQVLI